MRKNWKRTFQAEGWYNWDWEFEIWVCRSLLKAHQGRLCLLCQRIWIFNLKTTGYQWKFVSWDICSIWRFWFTDSSDRMGVCWKSLVRLWLPISSSSPWPMTKASDILWRSAQEMPLGSASQSAFQLQHRGSVLSHCTWSLFLYQSIWSADLWMICLVFHFIISPGKYLRSLSIPSPF